MLQPETIQRERTTENATFCIHSMRFPDGFRLRVRGVCGGPDAGDPFELPGNLYKVNLHTHTTQSDGDVELPVRVEQYKSHGYDILAVTDHEKTSEVAPFCTEDFLLISGMETHPKSSNPNMAYHLLCINVPVGMSFAKEAAMEERMEALREAGAYLSPRTPIGAAHSRGIAAAKRGRERPRGL